MQSRVSLRHLRRLFLPQMRRRRSAAAIRRSKRRRTVQHLPQGDPDPPARQVPRAEPILVDALMDKVKRRTKTQRETKVSTLVTVWLSG